MKGSSILSAIATAALFTTVHADVDPVVIKASAIIFATFQASVTN
jgi:hypothetical protein